MVNKSSQILAVQVVPDSTAWEDPTSVAPDLHAPVSLNPENRTLSTIIRFHRTERLPFLDEALFSLAIQSWREHETIIVVQNGDEAMKRAIEEIVARQPWPSSSTQTILSVSIPPDRDGRSTLLNRGIERAKGRYLAFLDDDDLVYHHCYKTLIQQLESSGSAVAAGGCRTARVRRESDHWYVQVKETPFSWGRTRNDLLRDNFVPIHSYVIDRSRIDPKDLWFDDECPPLEDYDFLLRLCARYSFDFSNLDIPVCEYRIHSMNSIPYTADAPAGALDFHQRAQKLINERKKNILCSVTVSELADLLDREKVIQENLNRLELEQEHEQQRFLNSITRKTYQFFGRFPRLERRLSKLSHQAWTIYKGFKANRNGK